MRNLLLLSVFVFLSSCNSRDGNPASAIGVAQDSALFYYKRSLEGTLSLTDRKDAINKALVSVSRFQADSLYSRVLYQKGRLSLMSGEYDSVATINETLLRHVVQMNDIPMLARQHYFMGYYFDKVVLQPDSAFIHYSHSKNYFSKLKDSLWMGTALFNMGVIQKDQNDFFGSKETLTEAWPYLVHLENKEILAKCHNVLASNYRKLLDYDNAIKHFHIAIKKTNSQGDELAYRNNLATVLADMGKYREAIQILQTIRLDTFLVQSSSQYARILDNLAYTRWRSKDLIKDEDFLIPLQIRIKNKDKRGQIASYTHLGEFYADQRPKDAVASLHEVVRLSKTIKVPRAELDALKLLMRLEPMNVETRDRYIFLRDSLYVQELKVKTQFAKYKYDNQISQETSLRLEKENAEKELELTRQRTQKTISLFGLALLLLSSGFLLYFLQQRTRRLAQRNKTAKLEATLETEAEMSRRLHDDFGAGLNQVMLMVEQEVGKNTVLDTVERLYDQSRNFSREINEVNTGLNFQEELLGMLQYRTPSTANLFITGKKEIDWDKIAALTKEVLYKVIQELMINMGKHSEASLVTIGFNRKGKMLQVNYVDNGVGATRQDLNARNGLRNTEKRIQAIGGTIIFDSRKDDGFKVQITIPI
nr:tetratricopeptide repeat-containing sensor histidine kinase [Allomuricauda sp.]